MKSDSVKVPGSGYHHIAIKASDYERSLAFYRDGLGFKVAHSWISGTKQACMLDLGDGNYIELFSDGPQPGRPEGDWVHFCMRTDDCDAAFAAACAAGAVPVNEPADVVIPANPPLPVRNTFVKGPDGELLEFFQYL